MKYSVNDRIKIGNVFFDIQTESRNSKIVSELFYKGKVIKKIDKPLLDLLFEREEVVKLHNLMHNFLYEKIHETSNKNLPNKTKLLDKLKIKESLLKLLEVDEDNLKFFFIKDGKLELFSTIERFCDHCHMDELIKEMREIELRDYGKSKNVIIDLKEENFGKSVFIYFIEGNKEIFLWVTGINFAYLKNMIVKHKVDIIELINEG